MTFGRLILFMLIGLAMWAVVIGSVLAGIAAADVRPAKLDQARAVAFTRAWDVTSQPEYFGNPDTLTDIRRPRCRTTSPTRTVCSYFFTIDDTRAGVRLYAEAGRLFITANGRRTVTTWSRVTPFERGN